MNNNSIDQAGTLTEIFQEQIELILAMISRPVVQVQIIVILAILLITWLLPEYVRRWRQRHRPPGEETEAATTSHRQIWLTSLYHIVTPTVALVLLYVVMWLFDRRSFPNGLLEDLAILLWLWFFYRLAVTLLNARFGEAMRPYRNWVLAPLFILLVFSQIFAILPGSITLVDVAVTLGTFSVTFGDLVAALLILYLFAVAAWVVKQIMMHSLPNRLNTEPGVIESVATLTRYALLALGIIISLGVLGLDITSLAIVAGGLSVGIGIGLQDFVSNFVSGLVLLFEQTLRPGDVVELDGRLSRVDKISLRATIVRTLTNEELVIPNNKFTTEQIKNLTRSDRLVRVIVPLGVSYHDDPELVRNIAIETALQHPLVLADPAPMLVFLGYGDSSLDFSLSVSINRPELSVMVRSDLYYALWRVFTEHDVTIPFPQRDLNLGDGWEKFSPQSQMN